MFDYEIQRFTRRCAVSDRELQPGESFYSVLTVEGAEVVRKDYAVAGWQGPPEHCLGWWKSQVPDPRATRAQLAPNQVLLQYFEQLQGDLSKADVAYILTLLLVRRRVFRLEGEERSAGGSKVLLVYCPRQECEYRVPEVTPAAGRVQQIQQELQELLFAKAEGTQPQASRPASDGP